MEANSKYHCDTREDASQFEPVSELAEDAKARPTVVSVGISYDFFASDTASNLVKPVSLHPPRRAEPQRHAQHPWSNATESSRCISALPVFIVGSFWTDKAPRFITAPVLGIIYPAMLIVFIHTSVPAPRLLQQRVPSRRMTSSDAFVVPLLHSVT